MPTKTWAQQEEVSANDFNTYLQKQVISTFATGAARDLALPSPTEGMVVYLADTKRYEFWTGTGWAVMTPRVAAKLHQTTIIPINSGVGTVITMGATDYSTGGAVAGPPNTLRVPVAGLYHCVVTIGTMNMAGNTGCVGQLNMEINVNAAYVGQRQTCTCNGFFFAGVVSALLPLNANDFIYGIITTNFNCWIDLSAGYGNQPATLSAALVSM